MNRMKLKWLAAITLFALMALMVTGCQNQETGDDAVRLRFVTYGAAVPADIKEVMAAANEYSREKIGVTVDMEIQPRDMINLIMASGEYYDIIFTSQWLNPFDKAAARGLYYDITDLLPSVAPELYKIVGEYWESATLNDRVYGVPTLKDMGTEMLYRLNADYFEDEKGMTIPETMAFEDIEPYLAAYKADYPRKYPLAMDKSGVPGFTNFLQQLIDTYIFIPYEQEGTPKALPLWECEELMKRYRLLHRWYQLGYINPDASTIDSAETDKSIPVRYGVAWRGYQGYSNPEDWGFRVAISIFDGPYLSRATEQGAMLALCAGISQEKAAAALKYIELLNTDRTFRDILAYGIEGKHFNYLQNGTVLRTLAGRERYAPRLYTTGSVINASVESVSEDFQADPDQWTKVYQGYREDAIRSGIGGFVYDQSKMESVIAATTAIYQNYATDLRTGTADPDVVIPKMRRELEAAGINELLEDINRQLEDWLSDQAARVMN